MNSSNDLGAPIGHSSLGRELDLFGSDPLIGAGLPYWLPAGAAIRSSVEDYVRGLEHRAGYSRVYSPVLAKRGLFEISGHLEHYREDMFAPIPDGEAELILRPSLCPGHALIYRSRSRSHRDLPLRLAELGPMFRHEPSGVLLGLSRVRSPQLNDAHIFARPDQVAAEVDAVLDLIERAYRDLGISGHRYRLSLRGESDKYVDDAAMWDRGEQALAAVLDRRGLEYESASGEGAFYGPKIDVQIVDPAGRESTLSTVQLDYFQPRRFDLAYLDAEQHRKQPVMIHRSIVGSMERLVAHLIDIHQGAFPAWLAPVQVVVMPIGDDQLPAAGALLDRLLDADLRAEIAGPDRGSLGARIRSHRRVPYLAVIGGREAADGLVSLRSRGSGEHEPLPVAVAVDRVVHTVRSRARMSPASG
ncbi:threonine--tRNA ligase [Pseudonocardia sp. GCM10023141]|uniref:threonine--tRNA ligase n=1 Tax=Pseudonocardia sp. GCM10023141 TaxID=3252653 RepID=UPI00361A49EC